MKPARQREVVTYLMGRYQVSERRAALAARFCRSSLRYQSRRDPQTALRLRLRGSWDENVFRLGFEFRFGLFDELGFRLGLGGQFRFWLGLFLSDGPGFVLQPHLGARNGACRLTSRSSLDCA